MQKFSPLKALSFMVYYITTVKLPYIAAKWGLIVNLLTLTVCGTCINVCANSQPYTQTNWLTYFSSDLLLSAVPMLNIHKNIKTVTIDTWNTIK